MNLEPCCCGTAVPELLLKQFTVQLFFSEKQLKITYKKYSQAFLTLLQQRLNDVSNWLHCVNASTDFSIRILKARPLKLIVPILFTITCAAFLWSNLKYSLVFHCACSPAAAYLVSLCRVFLLSAYLSGRYSTITDPGGPSGCCQILCRLHTKLRLCSALQHSSQPWG